MCAARSATDWRTVPTLLHEVETKRRTSLIAAFSSRASFSSLVSRATSDSWLAADEVTGRVVPLWPFSAGLHRRGLTEPAPTVERRLIAIPKAQGCHRTWYSCRGGLHSLHYPPGSPQHNVLSRIKSGARCSAGVPLGLRPLGVKPRLPHQEPQRQLPPAADMPSRKLCARVLGAAMSNRSKAAHYSIASSARASSVDGIPRPSTFAALRLMTSSYSNLMLGSSQAA